MVAVSSRTREVQDELDEPYPVFLQITLVFQAAPLVGAVSQSSFLTVFAKESGRTKLSL